MTLPDERARAIISMRNAARNLIRYAHGAHKFQNAKVPKLLLQDVVFALRHYPTEVDVAILARKAPSVLNYKLPAPDGRLASRRTP